MRGPCDSHPTDRETEVQRGRVTGSQVLTQDQKPWGRCLLSPPGPACGQAHPRLMVAALSALSSALGLGTLGWPFLGPRNPGPKRHPPAARRAGCGAHTPRTLHAHPPLAPPVQTGERRRPNVAAPPGADAAQALDSRCQRREGGGSPGPSPAAAASSCCRVLGPSGPVGPALETEPGWRAQLWAPRLQSGGLRSRPGHRSRPRLRPRPSWKGPSLLPADLPPPYLPGSPGSAFPSGGEEPPAGKGRLLALLAGEGGGWAPAQLLGSGPPTALLG